VSNTLSIALGTVLTEYGGTKYQQVSIDDMREHILTVLNDLDNGLKSSPLLLISKKIQQSVKRAKTKEKMLTIVSEAMLTFEGE
jgi:hypothetical protein